MFTVNSTSERDASQPGEAAEQQVVRVLLETAFLRQNSFNSREFLSLLELSKSKKIMLYAPQIVWEERRTQIATAICESLKSARSGIKSAESPAWSFITHALPPQRTVLWSDEEVERYSVKAMDSLAKENHIEVIGYAADHADRVWRRYFAGEPPFRSRKSRLDIPDGWIFEAAIDVKAKGGKLYALVGKEPDGILSDALSEADFVLCQTIEEFFGLIKPHVQPNIPVPEVHNPAFSSIAEQVLGFVTYFGSPSKERLYNLLGRVGMPRSVAETGAQQLILSGQLTDSGNHFIPEEDLRSEIAASKVEPFAIQILAGNGP